MLRPDGKLDRFLLMSVLCLKACCLCFLEILSCAGFTHRLTITVLLNILLTGGNLTLSSEVHTVFVDCTS